MQLPGMPNISPTTTPSTSPGAVLSSSGLGGVTGMANTGMGMLRERFPSLANKPSSPQQTSANSGFTRMETPARQALLTSMLARARGGQPGGAPLPAPTV